MAADPKQLASFFRGLAKQLSAISAQVDFASADIESFDLSTLSDEDFMAHATDVVQQLIARAQAAEASGGQVAALQQQLAQAQAQVTALQNDAVDPATIQAADAFLATPAPGATPAPAIMPTP